MTQTATATTTAVAPTYVEEARRYREQGGYRPELVDYLRQCGVDPAGAEHLADRFDLELGLAGHPTPHDINPAVAKQLDAHWALMASMAPVPPLSDPRDDEPTELTALDIANRTLPALARHAETASISATELAYPPNSRPEGATPSALFSQEAAALEAIDPSAADRLAVPVADVDAEIAAAQMYVQPGGTPSEQPQFPPVPVAPIAPIPEQAIALPAQTPLHVHAAPMASADPGGVAEFPPPASMNQTVRATVQMSRPIEEPQGPAQFPPPVAPTLAATQAELAAATPPNVLAEVNPVLAASLANRVVPQTTSQDAITAPPPMPTYVPAAANPASILPPPATASVPTVTPAPAPISSRVTSPPASTPHVQRANANEGPQADADWQETTEFGYRIAASWDEDDPNTAINEATTMARGGSSHEEIVAYLKSCHVSDDEAEYVASMTGARRTGPKAGAGSATAKKQQGRGRAVVLGLAMIVAGAVVAYLGYAAWQNGTSSGRRSPLSIAAVGGALILNGLRTLASR